MNTNILPMTLAILREWEFHELDFDSFKELFKKNKDKNSQKNTK